MDDAQAIEFRDQLIGKTVAGWLLAEYLGAGKSAVVMKAQRGSEVAAIKVFHPGLVHRYGKPVQLQRVLREKGLVGSEHPNLIRIYDAGECAESGHLYVLMELLPWRSMDTCLQEIPEQSVLTLLEQVASAARFLEDRQIAHRDIKPSNIVIDDKFNRAVLLDLGVIRPLAAPNITDLDSRNFIGTLRYSPPEFLLRREQDTPEGWRAITYYQLGAVLHDMLMKRPLFFEHSEPYGRLVQAILELNPQVVSSMANAAALAKYCLTKDPEKRLQLISWDSFVQSGDGAIKKSLVLREKIRLRQMYESDVSNVANELVAARAAQISSTLGDMCDRFQVRLSAAIAEHGCFSPRRTETTKDIKNKKCQILVQFEKAKSLGLRYELWISFLIELIDHDPSSPVFRISSSCAICSSVSCPIIWDYKGSNSIVSVPDQYLDGSAIGQTLLQCLECYYEQVDAGLELQVGEHRVI